MTRIIIAALVAFAATPALADGTWWGKMPNGVSLNGVGLGIQGLSLNGIGLGLQGISFNGISAGAMRVEVRGITLPPTVTTSATDR